MRFEWPIALAALVLLPVAIGLLWLAQRRRARYAIRFSNLGVLADVARETSSPWRFVPPVLLCAALATMAVGLARPTISVSAERKQGTVVLALDRSGSMLAQDVSPNRITASRDAATRFVKGLPSGFSVGVVAFSDQADVLSAPSRNKADAERAISHIQAGGGTAIGEAIERSLGLLGVNPTTKASKNSRGRAILLLSDGSNTEGEDPGVAADEAKRVGIPVYTIALGTPNGVLDLQALGLGYGSVPVPPDPEALKAIAQITGGESFTALDESNLKKVYDHIGTRVSATQQRKEITFALAGVAAALLFAAATASWLVRVT